MPEDFHFDIDVEEKDYLGSGKVGTFLVPDTIFGISLRKAGAVHDDMYEKQYAKELCDDIFLYNMRVLICRDYNLIIRQSALEMANVYHWAVVKYGQKSYEKCKIKD